MKFQHASKLFCIYCYYCVAWRCLCSPATSYIAQAHSITDTFANYERANLVGLVCLAYRLAQGVDPHVSDTICGSDVSLGHPSRGLYK